MKIALTGATGNMGHGVLDALELSEKITSLKLLVRDAEKGNRLIKKYKKLSSVTTLIVGELSDENACDSLVADTDYVINLCAVIPPHSDSNPLATIACNQIGVNTIVSAIEKLPVPSQPKFIHISTVALYGNRTGKHSWGRIGDPLLPSPFDIYSATKMRGEFRVLESDISNFVVLRQTAMLHPNMLSGNVNDGLMFHTCFDVPLEWLTAHDSGILIKNLIEKDSEGQLPKDFWKKCYNMGGGETTRVYGWQTLDEGFAMIGGSVQDFFQPWYNATRNFHGVWFLDSDELNDLLCFRTQSHTDYWNEILKINPYYSLGKIVPKKLIAFFVIKRLLSDKNAPSYWANHGDAARVTAYFGSMEKYNELRKKSWKEFDLPEKSLHKTPVSCVSENAEWRLDYGFDFSKKDSDIDIEDLRNVAEMHGGKLLAETYSGDIYEKLKWQTQDGEEFSARVYTVLRAGHWHNSLYEKNVWDFDRLCQKDKIFAQIWYDSHEPNESNRYYFDDEFNARIAE